jgi:deazaflavin-dependent oxidoreductase (nitroreductase family)
MDDGRPLLDDTLRAARECRLTTTGRSSGRPRRIELWFAAVGDRWFALAGGRDRAHWVRNLRVEPQVTVEIRGRSFAGRARVVQGTSDDPIARDAIAAKYGRRGLEDWLRESLPVAIDLDREVG